MIERLFKALIGIPINANKVRPDQRARWDEWNEGETNSPSLRPANAKDFLQVYKASPSVYAGVTDIAASAASVAWRVFRHDKELKNTDDVVLLLKGPNKHDTWNDLLKRTVMHEELTGDAFWEIVRDPKTKKIISIFSLRPDKVEILPHPIQKVAGYIYRQSKSDSILYDADEVIHFKYEDPGDDYRGTTPLMAAQNALTLNFFAVAWNKKFFQQGAEPAAVFETDMSITPQAYDRLMNTWRARHAGVEKSHIPAILEEGMKYRSITSKHSEMEFDAMMKMTKDEVYEALRIPLEWKTNPQHKKSFWLDNIIPKLKAIEETINKFLMRFEGKENVDDFRFEFVIRNILSLVEEDATKASIANQNVTHGIWTPNEARDLMYGMGKVPWGDTYMMAVGLAPWDAGLNAYGGAEATGRLPAGHSVNNDTEGGDRAGRSHPSQTPKLHNDSRLDAIRGRHPETSKAMVEKSEWIDLDRFDLPAPDGDNPVDYWVWKRAAEFAKAAGPDERKLIAKMRGYFRDQLQRLEPALRLHYPKPKKVKKDEGDPDVDAMLFDLTAENEILLKIFKDFGREMIKKYAKLTLAELGIRTAFDLDTAGVQAVMEKWAASRVTGINVYTRELLKNRLIDQINAGEDFESAIRALGEVFGPEGGISLMRARRIARTELITLTNEAKLNAAKQTGVVKRKMWVSLMLPTTRQEDGGANHALMHKQVIGIDESFDLPNRHGTFDSVHGPGDISASPENVVNCLCVLEFPPEDEEFADLFAAAVERGEKDEDVEKREKEGSKVVGRTLKFEHEGGEISVVHERLIFEDKKEGKPNE